VINTDAHAVGQLEQVRYGVFQARRAGLTRADVLNALPYERFREALRAPRARKPVAARASPAAPANKPAAKAAAKPKPAARPAARPKPAAGTRAAAQSNGKPKKAAARPAKRPARG